MTALLDGQLSKLTAADLNRLQADSRKGRRSFIAFVGRLSRLAETLRRVHVPRPALLSKVAQGFVSRWNAYLDNFRANVLRLRVATLGLQPLFADFTRLIAVARATTQRRLLPTFDRVRNRVRADVDARSAAYDRAFRAVTAPNRAYGDLAAFVGSHQEAQVIVRQVSDRYPGSFFDKVRKRK